MKSLKEEHQRLLKSKEFKNRDFLSSAFVMTEPENLENSNWQIDFYDKKTDKITNYLMNDKIEVTENSEVFKEEKTKVEELRIDEVKINLKEALEIADKSLKNNQEKPVKIIIILQKEKFPIWNISYMTEKFNLLNIKINAINSQLIKETTVSLLSFKS